MHSPESPARAVEAFRRRYDDTPRVLVRAPGRVNLIGEHTDYNDGFALPAALPMAIAVAAAPTADETVTVTSEGFGTTTFAIAEDPAATADWARYVHAMVRALQRRGTPAIGFRATIASDLPAGASLSSSAALEIATGHTLGALTGTELDVRTLAEAGREVEHGGFDLPGGLLDQIAIAAAEEDCALLVDFRDVTWRSVPVPAGLVVIVMDTGTRRILADSAYADRRRDCERAAVALGLTSLRDAADDDLGRLPDRLRRRARHVVGENHRTLAAAEALAAGDTGLVGELMDESHRSLRDDYEVSGPALDAMVAAARSHPACLGARMTGGGFAGGAIALVAEADAGDLVAHLRDHYRAPASQPAEIPPGYHVVRPSAGARLLPPPDELSTSSPS